MNAASFVVIATVVVLTASVLLVGLAVAARRLRVESGEFRLAQPDHTHVDTWHMRYSMALVADDGRRFRFEGHKVLHDRFGLDLWSDTTTLYVTISDAGGDAGSAQRFLERPQARVARTRPDHDQALRRGAGPGEAGGVRSGCMTEVPAWLTTPSSRPNSVRTDRNSDRTASGSVRSTWW